MVWEASAFAMFDVLKAPPPTSTAYDADRHGTPQCKYRLRGVRRFVM
jgi:hypothetical protein